MKYLFRILVGIFALIGVFAVCVYWYLATSEKYYISIGENVVVTKEAEFVDLLKQSPFKADTVQYQFAIVQDSARAQEIRNSIMTSKIVSSHPMLPVFGQLRNNKTALQ